MVHITHLSATNQRELCRCRRFDRWLLYCRRLAERKRTECRCWHTQSSVSRRSPRLRFVSAQLASRHSLFDLTRTVTAFLKRSTTDLLNDLDQGDLLRRTRTDRQKRSVATMPTERKASGTTCCSRCVQKSIRPNGGWRGSQKYFILLALKSPWSLPNVHWQKLWIYWKINVCSIVYLLSE